MPYLLMMHPDRRDILLGPIGCLLVEIALFYMSISVIDFI
jgi:hypothetical protein